MKNFQRTDDLQTFTAPSGGVVSGLAYLIGSLLVIAAESVAEGLPFEGMVEGVFDVPKSDDDPWSEGLPVYWDDSAKVFTSVPADALVGAALGPALAIDVSLATNAGAPMTVSGLAITVVTFGSLNGKTVTVTIEGVDHVLTEGADWSDATGNNETATSLATAIDALDGVTAAAVGAVVTVVPATGLVADLATTGRVRLDGVAR